MIHALPDILEEFPVKLVIVGHGPYAENLKELVKELELTDKVVFTGPVENEKTAYYYKAADFFISASTSETQGLTYLEAMAAGTRVLAAKNPYLSELINDDEFGQLFIGDDDLAEVTKRQFVIYIPLIKINLKRNFMKFQRKILLKSLSLLY